MRPYSPPPPARPLAPPFAHDVFQLHRSEILRFEVLRATVRRRQRSFLLVNAVPLSVAIVLTSFTEVPSASVYGQLTLGMVWGTLQCCLFVATAWLYEIRAARVCDPIEQSLVSGTGRDEVSGESTFDTDGR
ncbi:DUF485 domain-containing protein [Streptomyces tanashiensis]|uniref:DUF485 domain-containing protein n=1 Tax=Streptomyces tanashiensis TaxID=67367 RepID=UPI0036E98196